MLIITFYLFSTSFIPLLYLFLYQGGATNIIRWRYKLDHNGEIELDNNNEPIKESNARLVKLQNGTYKLLVGDAIFYTSIHKTEKR